MIKECATCSEVFDLVGRSNRCDGCKASQICISCNQPGTTRGTGSKCQTCYRKVRSCGQCGVEFRGLKSLCNQCRYENTREQRRENWERWAAENPSYRHKRGEAHMIAKYGINADDYQRMHDEQNGLCAICNRPETALGRFGKMKRLSVDHDHATGRVRALLCARCNPALGLFDDDVERVRAAADYLAQFKDRQVEGW